VKSRTHGEYKKGKKGPAIHVLMEQALQLRRRKRLAQRFLGGEWGVEMRGYKAARERERQQMIRRPT
jgi:hypothetical protein